MNRGPQAPALADAACFHCGAPLEARATHGLVIEGRWRAVCCPGCESVARAIQGQGLERYYALRERPSRPDPRLHADFTLYDDADVQSAFVHRIGRASEATLLLEGIRCSACAWLIEQALQRLPGMQAFRVNYATHRAQVRWDPQALAFSAILSAIASVGYGAAPYDARQAQPAQRAGQRAALWRLFVAAFSMMQVMMYALPAYIAGEGELTPDAAGLMRWASFALTVPVIAYSCQPFFEGAWKSVRSRRLGMDVPVALGIAVAFLASVLATVTGHGEVYFDSVSMFVFVLLLGRHLEALARNKAASGLASLARLAPESAHRLIDYPRTLASERVPAIALRRGDLVLVKPGERFPADGVVQQGSGSASEALLTGESRPVPKRSGSTVIGGAINISDPLLVRIEKIGAQTMLASLVRLAEHAASDRPRLVRTAERAVSTFLASVLVLAGAAAVYWSIVDPARALLAAVAVLVATCPCALSLATPAALTCATGALCRRGVVLARHGAIEALAQVTDFVFDKTGTLTRGQLVLERVETFGALTEQACLELAAAMDAACAHPVARALVEAAGECDPPPLGTIRAVQGAGVEMHQHGRRYRLGNEEFARGLCPLPHPPSPSPRTRVWLTSDAGPLAAFTLKDELRADAAQAVASLKKLGVRVHLLSGDHASVVHDVAQATGIGHVRAEAAPHGKLYYVSSLQQAGRRVAMVGDGVNDAPVLALADVSLAMAGGAPLAQLSADAVLVAAQLEALPAALKHARRTLRVVKQNVAWALGYNLLVLPLAVSGWLTPWSAALGMSASSLVVVLNALRLQRSD